MKKNQDQNQQPNGQQQNKHGQNSSRLEQQEPGKESETDTNQNDGVDNTGKKKQNRPDRDSGLDGLNLQWPNESLPSGGLVDREIGEGSEDLKDADSDDDEF